MTESKDRDEILGYYTELKKSHPGIACSVAAVDAILLFMTNNKMQTMLEFQTRFNHCLEALKGAESKHSSIASAGDLFKRYITLADMPMDDFQAAYKNMILRARHWVQKMANAKQTIARLAEQFIPNGTTLLTHSYSQTVMAVFKKAVKNGKTFKVFVTESQPDQAGLQTAKELKEMGISATVILDAAVSYIMETVELVIVGAENLLDSGGIFNKIGTCTMAMSAAAYNRPFYVVAETRKYTECYPIDQDDIPLSMKYKLSDDAKPEPSDYEQVHPLIDYTHPKYINRIITDAGVLPPGAILDEMLSVYH